MNRDGKECGWSFAANLECHSQRNRDRKRASLLTSTASGAIRSRPISPRFRVLGGTSLGEEELAVPAQVAPLARAAFSESPVGAHQRRSRPRGAEDERERVALLLPDQLDNRSNSL